MPNNDKLNSFIEELKAKNDIVSVISRYVTLERRGRSYWARCPFHGEKTPSFTVNEYDQFYHCFGCGVGGDVIKFVMEIESVDFMGAIHILADFAHMEVPNFSSGATDEGDIQKRKQEKDRLIALMKDAAHHYVDNLKLPQASAGIQYFEKRKISPQIARAFGLGFSLNFTDIIEHLSKKGYSLKEMETAGVVKTRDGRPYDAIGGRVVFPIIDTTNNVIAFCGRTLDPKPEFAKYINTADTPLFSKSKNLYALNIVKKAKLAGQKIDSLIVVEGQMDAVSLHKAGFNTAVASMGTSLTIEQAKLIKRFADKVYICYDGDTAGKKATLRGLDILKSTGLDVYVMSMPEGLDPDDVINKYGAEGYKKLMSKALPLVDFKLEFLKNSFDTTTSEGKTKFLSEAIEVLKGLGTVEREVYINRVSDISGVLRDFVRRMVESGPQADEPKEKSFAAINVQEQALRAKAPEDSKVLKAEKFILSAMLHSKPYAHFSKDMSEYFTAERQQFYKDIAALKASASEKEIPKLFYEKYAYSDADGEKSDLAESASEIINYIFRNPTDENDLAFFKSCVKVITKGYVEREKTRLSGLAEAETDINKRNEYLKQIVALGKMLNDKVD